MILYVLGAFATALLLAIVLTPASIFAAHRFNILDYPDPLSRGERSRSSKLHKSVVPRSGGLAIISGFFLASFWIDIQIPPLALYGSILLFIVGLWDDIIPIRASYRLLAQVAICATVVKYCSLELEVLNVFGLLVTVPSPVNFILPVFIIVGAVNSINMTDGMDGLAAGIALIAITMLSYLLYIASGELWYFGLIAISLGSILGFLKYNSHPATIFMGDGGSNWLGYLTGLLMVLCLNLTPNRDLFPELKAIPLASVLLCVAIPVFDTLGVIIARLKRGVSPMTADNNHFHHFLVRVGFGQKKVVTIIYFLALVGGTLAVFPLSYLHYELDWLTHVALGTVGSFLILVKFYRTRISITKLLGSIAIFERRKLRGWSRRIVHYWETIHRYAVYSLLFSGVLLPAKATVQLSYLALILSICLLVSLLFRSQPRDFLRSLLVAFSGAAILATNNLVPVLVKFNGVSYEMQDIYNLFFVSMAISTILYFILTFNREHLEVSPTDFLFIIIPLVMLIIPEPFQSQYKLGIISARVFVLYLCLRTFVIKHRERMRRAVLLGLVSLMFISLKGFLGFEFILP